MNINSVISIISIILLIFYFIVLILLIVRHIALTTNPFVIGEIMQVDLMSNESSNSYEATYRYKLNNTTRIFISDKRHRNSKMFKKNIKIHYKEDFSVYESPSLSVIILTVINIVIIIYLLFIINS